MIRINLLDARDASDVSATADRRQRVAAVCAAVTALAAAATIAWGAWALQREAHDLFREVRAADEAMERLAPVVRTTEAQERRRDELVRQVAIAEGLHAARGRPGRVLAALSRRLPDGLWFTGLRHEPSVIVVQGRATRLAAVVELVTKLEESNLFVRPVEIVDSQVEADPGREALARFEVRASLEGGG